MPITMYMMVTKLDRVVPLTRIFKKYTGILGWLLIVAGLVLFGMAGHIFLTSRKPALIVRSLPSAPSETATNVPSAPKPKASTIAAYNVSADNPKYIAIPAIGIPNTEVLKLGLTSSGAIAVPSSSYVTGWYGNSSKPGQSGAMFIYGHVLGWYTGGIFYNLHKLVPGDKIIVTRGDNTTYTYEVDGSKVYPANDVDMGAVLNPYQPNVPGLNLMTCTGQLNLKDISYNERLVVFTSLVSK
jgi:sortase (surface protein transpeptidase)